MDKKIISGIQQIGIGVPDVHEAFGYYERIFGTSARIFDDNGTAELMLPYTNGKPQNRHAVLALNVKGGSGFEIWQYTTRTPMAAPFVPQLGDLGIFICRIKCDDIDAAYADLKAKGVDMVNDSPVDAPDGRRHFYVKDRYGYYFEIVEGLAFFSKSKRCTGGGSGVVVGVSDMAASMRFYTDILEYDKVVYDVTESFGDVAGVEGGKKKFRRVLLTHSENRVGPFSRLLGASEIELFEAVDYAPKKLFEGRQWGDLGFIHLCYDIRFFDNMKRECAEKGFPFSVDSGDGDFDMGEAAGRFGYVEDPDGTLIEIVETLKIPIMKKLGLFLNLKNKNPHKPLPDGLLRLLKYL